MSDTLTPIDHFAAAALTALASEAEWIEPDDLHSQRRLAEGRQYIASQAWALADAMMAERSKRTPKD